MTFWSLIFWFWMVCSNYLSACFKTFEDCTALNINSTSKIFDWSVNKFIIKIFTCNLKSHWFCSKIKPIQICWIQVLLFSRLRTNQIGYYFSKGTVFSHIVAYQQRSTWYLVFYIRVNLITKFTEDYVYCRNCRTSYSDWVNETTSNWLNSFC